MPKPLIEIEGKPILDHILEMYIRKGFRDIVLCTGYKSEMIEERYKNLFRDECSTTISNSGTGASMLTRIRNVVDSVEKNIIVSYGDTLIDLDIDRLVHYHGSSGRTA